jgi:hypothetical protein
VNYLTKKLKKMERPERKKVGFLQQPFENTRYNEAMKEYNEWFELEKDRIRLENERLKLGNEQMRASAETMRMQEGLGGVEKMYDRVQKSEPKKKGFIEILNDLWKS